MEPIPHPANVPGDYFVEDGCCLSCEVPFVYAPELFAWALDSEGQPGHHCFIQRQPATPDEHERMFQAIRHAEAGCLLYRGRDRTIQERLVAAGEGPACVGLPDDLRRRSAEVLADLVRRRPRRATLWCHLLSWWRGKPR